MIESAMHALIVRQSEMVEPHGIYTFRKRRMELSYIIYFRHLGDQIANKRHSHSFCNSIGSA